MGRAFAIAQASKKAASCSKSANQETEFPHIWLLEFLLLVMAEYPGASSLQPDPPYSNEGSNEGTHSPMYVASVIACMKAKLMYILISIMHS